jgi:hypothetical protein
MLMDVGGNGYVFVGVFVWCFLLGAILFPDSAIYSTLSKLMDKFMNGGRQRW